VKTGNSELLFLST